jgi:hypothetical protein
MSGGTPEEMAAIQSAFAALKTVDTYDGAFAIAASLMPLRASPTLSGDLKQLVNELCEGAIAKAEDIKARGAGGAARSEPVPVPEPEPEPELQPEPHPPLGLPPTMEAPRAYSFGDAALLTGAAYERAGERDRAAQLYTDTVPKLLALRDSVSDAAQYAAVGELVARCLERLEQLKQAPPLAPPVWTPAPVVVHHAPVYGGAATPAVPFVPPDMPDRSDDEDEEGGRAGGWFSWGGSRPSEAELAERKRADDATRDNERMRREMQAMEAQMRQQQLLLQRNTNAAQHNANVAQHHKTREEQLMRDLQRSQAESNYTAGQRRQQDELSKQLISEGAAADEIEAKTALQKSANDLDQARLWLEEHRKQQMDEAMEKVEWTTAVTMEDYSNMEQVGPRSGVWFASRVVEEEEDGMTIEKSKKVFLKRFVLSDSVQPFLQRMSFLQRLEKRAAGLVLTPTLWFKDEESEAGVCTAYCELPRLETPVPLKDTAMCSDGASWDAGDEEDAPPDPGSRVKLGGRSGEIMPSHLVGGKVEVKWDDDFSTSRHEPSELTVIETAMERYGGGTAMMDVPEAFAAILKAVMQLHAHRIVGVVSVDSVVLEMGGSSGVRPLLTAGYSRRGIDGTSGSDAVIQAAAGAPELQETDGTWTEKTDIWVVGTLLHRALYEGKEPVLMPGKAQPSLPAAAGSAAQHGRDLTLALLQRDPSARLTATDASSHAFFSGGAAVAALKEEGQVVDQETKLAILREHVELLKSQHADLSLSLNIQRTSLIDSVLTEIMAVSASRVERGELLRKLRVRFIGEDGIDAGGLTKELFTSFARELFDPEKCGLFESCEGEGGATQLFLPSASFEGDPDIFEGVGRMLAMVLVASYPTPGRVGVPPTPGIPISLPLAPSLLRFLLYQQPTPRDYAAFDPQSASSLEQVLEMEDFDDMMLCMSFEDATDPSDPRHEEDVTEANREEYAKLKVMHQLVGCRVPQLTALRKGFESIKLRNQLRLFSVTELTDVMCGQQSVDADEVIAALEFSGFGRGTRTPQYIQETLRAWPEPTLKCFLRFITSMTCVPPDGGKIKISKDHGSRDAYPKAHTCFNRLDMPDYNDKAVVTQRLQFCVDNVDAAGFGEA